MASVRRPSSGSWKAMEPKFSEVRKRGVARLKATTTTMRKMTRPITSAPAKSRILR
jgi:hypothetical protein